MKNSACRKVPHGTNFSRYVEAIKAFKISAFLPESSNCPHNTRSSLKNSAGILFYGCDNSGLRAANATTRTTLRVRDGVADRGPGMAASYLSAKKGDASEDMKVFLISKTTDRTRCRESIRFLQNNRRFDQYMISTGTEPESIHEQEKDCL